MRDILPYYFIRETETVVFIDPKSEFYRERYNVLAIGKPLKGQGKKIYPIEDEAHNLYDPEAEKILDKLRTIGQRKRGIVMHTTKAKIYTETFDFGETKVTITNPNHYFPETSTLEEFAKFFEENSQRFDTAFHELADASRLFYSYSHSLKIQKWLVQRYLVSHTNKQLLAETGFSNKTISEWKNEKKPLERVSVQTFETLYKCALKSDITFTSEELDKSGLFLPEEKERSIRKQQS